MIQTDAVHHQFRVYHNIDTIVAPMATLVSDDDLFLSLIYGNWPGIVLYTFGIYRHAVNILHIVALFKRCICSKHRIFSNIGNLCVPNTFKRLSFSVLNLLTKFLKISRSIFCWFSQRFVIENFYKRSLTYLHHVVEPLPSALINLPYTILRTWSHGNEISLCQYLRSISCCPSRSGNLPVSP